MSLTITSTSTVEVRLAPGDSPVLVTGSGTINTGNSAALYGDKTASWAVTNHGLLAGGQYGVEFAKAGSVTNGGTGFAGATIRGATAGIFINKGAGTVANDGTVLGTGGASAGVDLQFGGSVVNGQAAGSALIQGVAEGVWIAVKNGTVTNAGSIAATGTAGLGVLLAVGGNVTNGAGNTAATISGVAAGVSIKGTGNVINTGGITASAGIGVYRVGVGSVVNGSSLATGASILGATDGVRLVANPATKVNLVVNYGTITGQTGNGVNLQQGGRVTNGSASIVTARIAGGMDGVLLNGAGTVVNFGTIVGAYGATGSYGVNLMTGGQFVNGSNADSAAYVYGSFIGVQVHGFAGTVQNFGTIAGGQWGIYTWKAGTIINGSLGDTTALITGRVLGTWNTYPGETILNYATITSSGGSGVDLASGGHSGFAGTLVNGTAADTVATISGVINGVTTVHHAVVDNYGTMVGGSGFGCYVTDGGALTNGSAADTVALITGSTAGAGLKGAVMTLVNDGTIVGSMMGAALFTGGTVFNGTPGITGALIQGGSGTGVWVGSGPGTVLNDATIVSSGGYGVSCTSGGRVVNGATTLTGASISGTMGVGLFGSASTVVNDGTITGTSLAGVELAAGGQVTNGESGLTTAWIGGGTFGVLGTGSGAAPTSVANAGTIVAQAAGGVGIYLQSGGTVTNGSASDTVASIAGAAGVRALRTALVTNCGTITATGTAGVYMQNVGSVTNGSTSDTAALIAGATQGVWIKGAGASVVNDGTILASAASGIGVYLNQAGSVTNGVAAALIQGGAVGIRVIASPGTARVVTNAGTVIGGVGIDFSNNGGAGTVINAGTIQGTTGDAVQFGNGNDLLVVDTGAVFQGLVDGGVGTNTIELAAVGGGGTLSGLGVAFVDFATVKVDSGASWTLGGTDAVATLVNTGTLNVAAGASLDVATVDPSSVGVLHLQGSSLEVGAMTGSGSAIQFIGGSSLVVDNAGAFGSHVGLTSYTGPLLQDFGSADQIDLINVAFAGASLAYNATTGLMQISAGATALASLQFDTATVGSGNFHLTNDGAGHTLVTIGP